MRDNVTTASLSDLVFRPRSVAVVGASADPTKTSSRPVRFLQQHGFQGKVHVVNPRQPEVFGVPTVASVDDLPQVPDHAYILLNTEGAMDAVQRCVALGVPVVTVLASGFGEAGPEGKARERVLRDLARNSGTRILGPNSLGVVNTHNGLTLTANAAFAEGMLTPGRFMLASQSGSMLGAVLSRGQARGIGFSRLVSVGNEVDLDVGTLCSASVDDPDVDGFLLFLETIRHSENLAAFAARAHAAGKPIIAYKLGRSDEGRELAVSHTGAMLTAEDVADAFLKDNGIARVTHLESLFEAAPLFAGWATAQRSQGTVGVVTTTGGGGAMVIDQLGLQGTKVVGPSPETLRALAGVGIDVGPGRLIDLTLAGANYDAMTAALGVLRNAAEFDALITVIGSSARTMPHQTIQPILDSQDTGKAFATFVVPDAPDALRIMAAAGIPAFRTPEACADAVGAFLDVRPPRVAPRPVRAAAAERRTLSETASLELFASLGVPVPEVVEFDVREGPPAVLPFGYPVVAKALSNDLSHKTDAGGVVLGISGPEDLSEAAGLIVRTVRARAGVEVARILVEPMVRGITELLIGYSDDPQVGPVITISSGGVLAELSKERILRLAPVDEATAREMIEALPAAAVLNGYRGGQKGDVAALARAIAAFSRMAEDPRRAVLEAEINPLCVLPEGQGVVALDALAVVAVDS